MLEIDRCPSSVCTGPWLGCGEAAGAWPCRDLTRAGIDRLTTQELMCGPGPGQARTWETQEGGQGHLGLVVSSGPRECVVGSPYDSTWI